MKRKTRNTKRTKRNVRAKIKRFRNKSMAFFRRRFRRPRYNNRPRFSRRRYSGGGSFGFTRSLGIKKTLNSPLLILLALVGGGLYFFKDQLRPLLDKLKNHSNS